ncbi:amino acid permease-1 [Coleophoma cylindrospora]|uniref:Amino acid permease-1 n=1 Tax=Coleophoma cylindrospora TaxID=1849047 RepID=A0A3D8QCX3_9HELO|nr:amino acid permease-1 [Coleophoma cylindrospora]
MEQVDRISTAPPPVAEKKPMERTASSGSSHDIEKRVGTTAAVARRLKPRHLQMIAIGGTIGTGLFIGSGSALAKAGPVGALIAYIFVGSLVYSVMISLGEMATYIPITGAFTQYATRFVDPSLGFAMGWIYYFSWSLTYALELTATGLIIQYWDERLSIGIFIGVFWAIITAVNFLPVSFYGEFEFWFSTIKVITVVGFLIFAICIDAGAGQNGYLGFHTWKNPGAFVPYLVEGNEPLGKFVGFWAVLIQAGFSYQGTELVGIAAGECENPRKNVPAAIKKTFFRILIFFVFTIFFIGLLVPSDSPDLLSAVNSGSTNAAASPFVIAAKLAGVKALPSIINAVLLFVVLSAANSNVYSGSRILVGLAEDGSAPALFYKTDKRGVPYYSVAFTAMFGLLGFLNLSAGAGTVFTWLQNIVGVGGFINWASINGSHIAFQRALAARNIPRNTLPYVAWWQPYFAWYGLVFNILILLTQGFTCFMPWDTSSFFAAYISVILFVVLYIGHKIIKKTSFVKPIDADIATGCVDFLDDSQWSISAPTTIWGKVKDIVM